MKSTLIFLSQLVGSLTFGLGLATVVEFVLDPKWKEQALLAAVGAAIGIAFWVLFSVREVLERVSAESTTLSRVLVQPRSVSFVKRGEGYYLSSSQLWVMAWVPPATPGRVILTLPSGYSAGSFEKGAGTASWEAVNEGTFEVHLSDAGFIDLGRVDLRTSTQPSARNDVIRLQFIPNESTGPTSPEERVVVSVDL